jgi:protoporphyrinogen oxidase
MRCSSDTRFVILGAGPTGLGAAYRLRELGHEHFHVYDRADQVGGLAASYRDERGFTWDVGGHVQFSHYRYFDDVMERALGNDWLHHEREAWIWMERRFVPYPLQNNLHRLSPGTRWKCVQGLVKLYKQPPVTRPRHFGEWIDATFGAGLAEAFMLPYNFKVWAYPAERLDYNWIGERVAVTDLERVLDNLLHDRDDVSWGPNNTFQFPRCGGTGAIWRSVAGLVGRDRITLGREAVAIDTDRRQVRFADGSSTGYDVLLSTIPIVELVDRAGLDELRPVAAQLVHSSSHIVGVGLAGRPPEALRRKCWMYFPEGDCPFYRVTVFSNYSPRNVPDADAHWSLMAEISESPHRPVDPRGVVAATLDGLRATGLIGPEHEVASCWHRREPFGYPTPALGRDDALHALHRTLESRDVYSRGRFGGWKYEVSNQDHSLMQGVELVNRLLLDIPEVTYWFPGTANDTRYAKRSASARA